MKKQRNAAIRKGLACFLALIILIVAFPMNIFAENEQPMEFNYTIVNGTSVKIMRYTGQGGMVSIPSEIEGKPVTCIAGMAFVGGQALEDVFVPDTVTNIEKWAFYDAGNLMNITVDINNPNYMSNDGVLFDKSGETLLQYPAGRRTDSYYVPSGTHTIGRWAFAKTYNCRYVNIPDSVTVIDDYAFWCTNLETAVISKSISEIGDCAFALCDQLYELFIPASIETIGEDAFYSCERLKLYSPAGSAAERYAYDNGISFMQLSPITSVNLVLFQDYIYENTNYQMVDDWINNNHYEYRHYNIPDYSLTVNYENSDPITYDNAYQIFEEDGRFPYFVTDQSYENQWGTGIHDFTLIYRGYEIMGELEIRESNVVGFSFVPAENTIYENTCGRKEEQFANGNYESFWMYDINQGTYTVELDDGTQKVYTQNWMLEQEFGAHPVFRPNQDIDNQWGIGTYTVTVEFFGFESEFDIEILESQIKSVQISPKKNLILDQDCYSATEMIDNQSYQYNKYNLYDQFIYTINMKDGSTEVYEYASDIYSRFHTEPVITDNQSHTNQWGIGEYPVEVELFGDTYIVNVSVAESPVESIEILRLGKTEYYSDEVANIDDTEIRINYNDDTEEIRVINSDPLAYGITDVDGYSLEYMLVGTGNEKSIELRYLGSAASKPVTVIEKTIVSSEFLKEPLDRQGVGATIRVEYSDEETEDFKIIRFFPFYGDLDDNMFTERGVVYTDKGFFERFEIKAPMYGLLSSMEITFRGTQLQVTDFGAITAQENADRYICSALYNKRNGLESQFINFNGEVTSDNIDMLIHSLFYRQSLTVPGSDIRDAMMEKLDIPSIDLTISRYYNAENDTYSFVNEDSGGAEKKYVDCIVQDGEYNFVFNHFFEYGERHMFSVQCTSDSKISAVTELEIGDVNIDGTVDVKDLVRLKKKSAGMTVAFETSADVDGDGKVMAKDLAALKIILLLGARCGESNPPAAR